MHSHLCLRQLICYTLDTLHHQIGNLLELSSLLYRSPEICRYRRASGALPEAICENRWRNSEVQEDPCRGQRPKSGSEKECENSEFSARQSQIRARCRLKSHGQARHDESSLADILSEAAPGPPGAVFFIWGGLWI